MSTARYAAGTAVSANRSRDEIERTLARYGATSFVYGADQERAVIGFIAHNRQVRFYLPMPDPNDSAWTRTPTGRQRTTAQARQQYEQAVRQRWRALALVIKAKLEAVQSGVVTFEQEFLSHTMLPNGQTVAEWAGPQLDYAYESQAMPSLLPGGRPELEP